VLVATTVIEVGVDVPNATLIVIEARRPVRAGPAPPAARSGGAGRGAVALHPAARRRLSETSRARLALMRDTTDGFLIAERDLELRGAGELLGTRQSGEQTFRLATPESLASLIVAANADARLLEDQDRSLKTPRGEAARVALYLFERDAAVSLLRAAKRG
jgi:ATP-dependent DNA helicase RecG